MPLARQAHRFTSPMGDLLIDSRVTFNVLFLDKVYQVLHQLADNLLRNCVAVAINAKGIKSYCEEEAYRDRTYPE